MAEKVWMVGAGDLARELYGWIVCEEKQVQHPLEVIGFIDDAPVDLKPYDIDLPVMTMERIATDLKDARFIMGLSSPADKRSMAARLEAAGARPLTYIHSSVLLGRQISIGTGSVISPRTVICSGATVGAFCTVNAFCEVGHEATVGNFSTLFGHNALNGRVQVGEDCTVGCGAIFHPGARIGDGATVGLGSVVLSHVREKTTYFGNPAKRIAS